jgi:hypothetical protein
VAGVMGTSGEHPGIVGTSTNAAGVAGYSKGGVGVYGETGGTDPSAYAGFFRGNLRVTGRIDAGTKDAIVPFPDGSQRASLHGEPGALVRGFRHGEAQARARGGQDRCRLRQSDQAERPVCDTNAT